MSLVLFLTLALPIGLVVAAGLSAVALGAVLPYEDDWQGDE